MPWHRRRLVVNPGNWLLGAGLIALGVTFWIPFVVAQRTARVEGRADALAAVLLQQAGALQPFAMDDPFQRAVLEARVQAAAAARGVFAIDLRPLAAPPGTLRWANKHYLFQLAVSPPPMERDGGQGAPPLEVMAWPHQATTAGHAAFFHCQTADSSFTRNLQHNYAGADHAPAPGAGHRRSDPRGESPWSYRGLDDERWLVARLGALGRHR